MARLNIEVVQQAIADIRQDNEYPSNERIIERLGYGSKSTLTKLRAKYPSVFDGTNIGTVSTSNGTHNINSGTTISVPIQSQGTESSTRFDALETQLKLVLEHLDKTTNSEATPTTQFEALETQNAQLKRDLLKAQNELDNASSKLDLNRRQLEKRDNEIDSKQQHIETLETENNELKQQFDRLQADSERQQSDLKETLDKVEKLENELKVATESVDSLAVDNEALRDRKTEPVDIGIQQELDRLQADYEKQNGYLNAATKRIDTLESGADNIREIVEYAMQYEGSQGTLRDVLEKLDYEIDNLELPGEIETSQNSPVEPESTEQTELPIAKTTLTSPEKNTKERFFELLDKYPENKLVEFAEILDSEGFKNKEGKKIGTGTLSKWKNKRFKKS